MSDILFSIYKYKVEKMPGTQLNAFDHEVTLKPKNYKTEYDFFESFLPCEGGKFDLWKPGRKEKGVDVLEKVPHNNRVMAHRDNLIVMSVQANKTKKINEEDWTVRGVPDHPSFCIMIDNRPGHQYVAIQHAAMDTDDSASMLMNSLHYEMQKYGYRFEIERLIKSMKFMEAVYYIKDKLKDKVRKVTFDFKKDFEGKEFMPSRFVHALKEWIGEFADSGQISANVSDDNKMKNETVRQDLELMAELCSVNNHYKLLVKFERFGLYRYGNDVRAQYGLDDKIINDFVSNKDTDRELFDDEVTSLPRMTLEQWFDDGDKIYKNYEKEELSKKRRKRTNRL